MSAVEIQDQDSETHTCDRRRARRTETEPPSEMREIHILHHRLRRRCPRGSVRRCGSGPRAQGIARRNFVNGCATGGGIMERV